VIAETERSKRALRLALKADLLSVGVEVRAALSDRLSQKLLALPRVGEASAVLVFLPMPHEPDLTNLARSLLHQGVTVCLPRIDWDRNVFRACQISSVDEGLEIRRYNVPEPAADAPEIDPQSLDVVLTPALAFDRIGNRLGQGAGMYDRFLAKRNLRAWVCGVGYESQLVSSLPEGPNDQKVDAVATDRRLLLFPGRQRQGMD
jgi:5-formyltetrahydrofolate cyclo-ligase